MPLLTGQERAHHGRILKELAALAETGLVHPLLNERGFGFHELEDAYRSVETGGTGKVVVTT